MQNLIPRADVYRIAIVQRPAEGMDVPWSRPFLSGPRGILARVGASEARVTWRRTGALNLPRG